jgi:hypothetical protein
LRSTPSAKPSGQQAHPSKAAAVEAWVQIGQALAGSSEASDRQLADNVADFVKGMSDTKVAELQRNPVRAEKLAPRPSNQPETRPLPQQQTLPKDIDSAR